MVREPAIGFVTEIGTRTSHTSIMARALEIPAVVGVADALQHVRSGDMVIVDGLRGEIVVHPTEAMIADARERSARHLAFARGLLTAKRSSVRHRRRRSGVSSRRTSSSPPRRSSRSITAPNGIGLYRTEFLYIDRATQPDEQEQYELYRAVIEAVPRARSCSAPSTSAATSSRAPSSSRPR